MNKSIDIIAGARPNFMKIAPIIRSLEKDASGLNYRIVHTGQHYDSNMSGSFFTQLGIPEPHVNLEVGSGTQAEQTAGIMTRYEKLLTEKPTDLCLVVGDVTSTLACTIVARKHGIPVAHVEGGLRSGDWSMPEEINRVVTDSITNYFFTTSVTANENLLRAGAAEDQLFFVGNTMIDTLVANLDRLRPPSFWEELNLEPKSYFILTLHRPANVDAENQLQNMISEIGLACRDHQVIFPAHPRTRCKLEQIRELPANIILVEPQPYLEFNYLVQNAKGVITDSGGITEETTYMGVPCFTLRDSTERPETVDIGTNDLVGTNPAAICPAIDKLFAGELKTGRIPELWDGKTGARIVAHLQDLLVNSARP